MEDIEKIYEETARLCLSQGALDVLISDTQERDDSIWKARELKGEVSGEHGIGYAKRPFLNKARDPALMSLMQAIKDALDPNHILNPHKISDQ